MKRCDLISIPGCLSQRSSAGTPRSSTISRPAMLLLWRSRSGLSGPIAADPPRKEQNALQRTIGPAQVKAVTQTEEAACNTAVWELHTTPLPGSGEAASRQCRGRC
jgi:hypothetical protein